MLPRIAITRRWSDDDVAQLAFEVCDGMSLFATMAYVPLDWGVTAASGLQTFSRQIHGGLFNLEVGQGGREYSSGAFRARFHWYKPNQLLISTRLQGEFFSFKASEVAAEASMYLRTEPALLDSFIAALPALDTSDGREAVLECVSLNPEEPG